MVTVEKLVEWRLAGETEVLGENLPQLHLVHHKSHMNPGRRGVKPATNRLSYGAAVSQRLLQTYTFHTGTENVYKIKYYNLKRNNGKRI
jgi:hypothetical protein